MGDLRGCRIRGADGYLLSSPSTGDGEVAAGTADGGELGSRRGAEYAEEWAEAGIAEMRKVYDETGRLMYMGAGDREHD